MKITIGNKVFEVSKEQMESNPNEVTIDFDGILRTGDEETSFIENHKKDARKEGLEIAVKQYREEFGFEGRTIDKLIEGVKSKTLSDAKIEPTEKLKNMQGVLDEKEIALQNALAKVVDKDAEFQTYKNQSNINSTISGLIPKNILLPKEDLALILKNKLKFDTDENGNVVVLDSSGNVMKDPTTANPLNPKAVVDNFFKDNQTYLKPVEGGAGGGDSSSKGGKQTVDELIEELSAKNISPNSEEFSRIASERVKAGTLDVE